MSNDWLRFTDQQPPSTDANEIEISYDGIEVDDSVEWMERRTCMMAGYAGGYGYFGEGWGTNGLHGCGYGLICDPPEYWRLINSGKEQKG